MKYVLGFLHPKDKLVRISVRENEPEDWLNMIGKAAAELGTALEVSVIVTADDSDISLGRRVSVTVMQAEGEDEPGWLHPGKVGEVFALCLAGEGYMILRVPRA